MSNKYTFSVSSPAPSSFTAHTLILSNDSLIRGRSHFHSPTLLLLPLLCASPLHASLC